MGSAAGVTVDLNILQREMGILKEQLQRNEMTDAKAHSTALLADLTSLNVLIQAATNNNDLPDSPTLA